MKKGSTTASTSNKGFGAPKKLTEAEKTARFTVHVFVGDNRKGRCTECQLHLGWPVHVSEEALSDVTTG